MNNQSNMIKLDNYMKGLIYMKIGITNDHRGVKAKDFLSEYLTELGYTIIDYGADKEDPVDFPDYAKKLGDAIIGNEVELGIAICGTGIGMSIALNKMHGIYCAKVSTVSEATLSKAHNDANAIAISEEMDHELMKEVVTTFIKTPFTNIDRYKIRNDKIKEIEKNV